MGYVGVRINEIDTLYNYGLILLADVVIGAPTLKENRIDIPGAHGSLDLSFAVTGEPLYNDRPISFTLFKQVNDLTLNQLRDQLAGVLHGRRCRLSFPFDYGYYYIGTIKIGDLQGYNSGRIPISMTAAPHKLKNSITSVSSELTGEYTAVSLVNDYMPAVPTITVTEDTTLLWNGTEYAISAGTHRLLDIRLTKGVNNISAKLVTAASGTITFEYQEGRL